MANLDEKKLDYLQKVIKSDFYQNDREFVHIIKKLTKESADLNNKAVSLASVLNEAEQIKLEMVQKEIELGLSEQNKPYGEADVADIKDVSLVYKNDNISMKRYIERFIYVLENYLVTEDLEIKKTMFQEAKSAIDLLKSNGVDPIHFIITQERSKVWYLLDNAYSKTMKKFSIDFFIQKIRNTRLQHIDAVESIKSYNEEKQRLIFELSKARKEDADEATIKELQQKLQKELSVDVSPLLIDTQKIMDSLDFVLEEIPQEIDKHQVKEIEAFLPVLSEYYIDQTYAISGGHSFTTLAKNLSYLQKIIDNNASGGKILNEVSKLDYTMQHLYILHWIGESLLKEILRCYHHQCSMGVTIKFYKKDYANTITKFKEIQQAVFFRNDIAHNGIIWSPEKLKTSIDSYKEYIVSVTKEQKFDLQKFHLPRMDRELTPEQIQERVTNIIYDEFGTYIENIDEKIVENLTTSLQKNNWKLPKKEKGSFSKKIFLSTRENFCKTHFNMDFAEAKKYFIEYEQKKSPNLEGNDLEKKALASLHWTLPRLEKPNEKSEVEKNIIIMKKRIESVVNPQGDKKAKGLMKWLS